MQEIESNGLTGLRRLFNKSDLDADKFINNVSRQGRSAIIENICNLQKLSDEASVHMKRAIYNNFQLFIDVGKAVSGLGATMHQLDQQLVEQQRICESLSERSLFKDVSSSHGQKSTDFDRFLNSGEPFNLDALLNSVEGVSNLVTDSCRQLLFDGDVAELNSTTYLRQGQVHLFVLTDYVLVSTRQADSYGVAKYRKQALYEIENVITVNVKSRDAKKSSLNLIQLQVFPEPRLFQMNSLKDKRAFLSAVENAKKLHVAGVSLEGKKSNSNLGILDTRSKHNAPSPVVQPVPSIDLYNESGRNPVVCPTEVENACLDAIIFTIPDTSKFLRDKKPISEFAGTDSSSGRIKNPFQQDTVSSSLNSNHSASNEDVWLLEAPEDIDVAVSIRDFGKATQIISKSRRRILELKQQQERSNSQIPSYDASIYNWTLSTGLNSLSDRIEERAANLSVTLEEELARASERQGAVRSVRAAVLHLAELGKTVLALHLYLTYRSSVMSKLLARGVKQEGNQLVYLNSLSLIFHRCLVETATEWGELVKQLRTRSNINKIEDVIASKLYSWVLEETVQFSNKLKIVLIDSRSISFYAIASATERIHAHSTRVAELIGIDVRSALDTYLLKSWQHAAEEQTRVYQDALEHRVSKENWRKVSDYSAQQVEQNIKVMVEAGFPEIKQSLSSGQQLSSFTMQSACSLSYFIRACVRFDCGRELGQVFSTCLATMLQKEADIYANAIKGNTSAGIDNSFILANIQFFYSKVISKFLLLLNCETDPAVVAAVKSFKRLLRVNQ